MMERWIIDNDSFGSHLRRAAADSFFKRLLLRFASRGCAKCVFVGCLLKEDSLSNNGCLSNKGALFNKGYLCNKGCLSNKESLSNKGCITSMNVGPWDRVRGPYDHNNG